MPFLAFFLLISALLSFLLGRECTPTYLPWLCGMPGEAKVAGWFLAGTTLLSLLSSKKR